MILLRAMHDLYQYPGTNPQLVNSVSVKSTLVIPQHFPASGNLSICLFTFSRETDALHCYPTNLLFHHHCLINSLFTSSL